MDVTGLRRTHWSGGQLLAFSGIDGQTDFENGLTARTAFESPGLDVKLPGECSVRFGGPPAGDVVVAGDFFDVQTDAGRVRGALLDAHHLLIEGPCEILDRDDAVACCSQNGRTLIGSASDFDATKLTSDLDTAIQARSRWLQRQSVLPSADGSTCRTLCKALSTMKAQVYTPEGQIRHRWTTPDRWPHRRMWLWDSAFHAIGWRHVDPTMARDMITAVLDCQRHDGFIAHALGPSAASDITQPPVLGLAVKMVNEAEPDEQSIAAVYPKLCAYVDWDLANRDTDGAGLVEWFIEGDPHCRSGESGMDNSPRFDTATQLDAVDFNSFLALECELLADFANSLGLPDDAGRWRAKHKNLCQLINDRLWSEAHGFYLDYDVDRQQPSSILASSGFFPLICGAASRERAEQLAAHLQDPEMFGTAVPVPSMAACDVEHYSKDMWRGPMWPNVNWLVAHGFERCGMSDVANELRDKTIQEIERCCERYVTFFELYDDRREVDPPALLRKGKCAPEESPYHQVVHELGWTAAVYVDMVCQRELRWV